MCVSEALHNVNNSNPKKVFTFCVSRVFLGQFLVVTSMIWMVGRALLSLCSY